MTKYYDDIKKDVKRIKSIFYHSLEEAVHLAHKPRSQAQHRGQQRADDKNLIYAECPNNSGDDHIGTIFNKPVGEK